MTRGLKTAGLVLCTTLVVAAAMCNAENQIYDERADAHEQIETAIAQASRSGKNVVLDFGANWCLDCHVLDAQMHSPELAGLVGRNYVVVHVDVGRFNKNLNLARKYDIPLDKGIPALAVLDPHGKLLYSQDRGQFEDARHLAADSFKQFFDQWKPRRSD
jgi:thioredoxin 1